MSSMRGVRRATLGAPPTALWHIQSLKDHGWEIDGKNTVVVHAYADDKQCRVALRAAGLTATDVGARLVLPDGRRRIFACLQCTATRPRGNGTLARQMEDLVRNGNENDDQVLLLDLRHVPTQHRLALLTDVQAAVYRGDEGGNTGGPALRFCVPPGVQDAAAAVAMQAQLRAMLAAAHLTNMPANQAGPRAFAELARRWVTELSRGAQRTATATATQASVRSKIRSARQLRMGLLHAVGRAGQEPARLLEL